MKVFLSILNSILFLAASVSLPSISYGEDVEASNLGQDPSRPLARIDLRYSQRDESELLDRNVTTLRLDYPLINERWVYYFRTDLTYVENRFSGANSSLDDSGMGPTTLIAAMSYQFQGSGISFLGADSAGFGFQTLVDTSEESIDPGRVSKTNAAALAGAKWSFEDFNGFFFPVIKYWRDIEKDRNATDTNIIAFQPLVNVPFRIGSMASFLSFYQTYDIRYNLDDSEPNNKGLHLPIDVAIGIQPTKSLVLSLEYVSSVIEDFERFDSIIEFRVGHLF